MCFTPRRIPKHLILQQPTPPSWLSRNSFKVCWALLLLLVGFGISDLVRAQNSTDHNSQVSESELPAAGALMWRSHSGYQQATHLSSAAQVDISGMVARLTLTQHFKNESEQWQQAVYVFPLSPDSAVNRMVMTIGEKRIVARIKEKKEAEKIYKNALADGKKAAITSQQRPNLFTQRVANIAPGETVAIELHITQPVQYDGGRFSWRLPMTLTPRYIPGAALLSQSSSADKLPPLNNLSKQASPSAPENTPIEVSNFFPADNFGWSLPTSQVPDAHTITPPYRPDANLSRDPQGGLINPITISVALEAGLPLAQINASYHDIDIQKRRKIHHIKTRFAQVPMDRDFELSWQAVADQTPQAAIFTENIAGEDYAMVMITPNSPLHKNTMPRDLIFIIDTSGSMSGPSIIQAKQSLLLALSSLAPSDRFNIIEFNSSHSSLFNRSVMANRNNLNNAKVFVNNLQASGGTEMAPALAQALQSQTDEGWLKQIVFITDGSVGNEAALFSLIHQHLGSARLFTVGIGSAPNSFFMRKAAQFGRGSFTHIGDSDQIAENMQKLFNKLESAVLTNIQLRWPATLTVEHWPQRLPDLYAGEPLVVAVKFAGNISATDLLTVAGNSHQQNWQQQLSLQPLANKLPVQNRQNGRTKGIATLWARAKIEALLDKKVSGGDAVEIRTAVLAVALTHELLSPYTSLVAVDETPATSRPTTQTIKSQAVANLLPQGQSAPALMYPKTATSAPLLAAIALLALLLLALINRRAVIASLMRHA